MRPKKDRIVKSLSRTKTHTRYKTSDGKVVPGGSTLAKVVSFGSMDSLIQWGIRLHDEGIDPQAARVEMAELGTCLHKQVECRFKGEPFPADQYPPAFTEQASRMADSFFQEIEMRGWGIVESEIPYISDKHRYGGTLDLILEDTARNLILGDLKSTSGSWFIPKDHILQVGGFYRELFREFQGEYPLKTVLFRCNRDTGACTVYEIPDDRLRVASKMVPLVRELYSLRYELEKK